MKHNAPVLNLWCSDHRSSTCGARTTSDRGYLLGGPPAKPKIYIFFKLIKKINLNVLNSDQ